MLNFKTYGAIDIGSNAVRLLISNIIESDTEATQFKKRSLVRVPIRLGADVFVGGSISKYNETRMLDTMKAFSLLIKSHGVEKYKACATSAMREASNGKEITEKVRAHCGIEIDIIGGEEEAAIIAATDLNSYIDPNKTYLYVDVGGGSTEFSVIHQAKKITSKSFKIGTVRLLNNMVSETMWNEVEQWIKSEASHFDQIALIGSGGNINKIFKESGIDQRKPMSFFYLTNYYNMLQSLSYDERITKLSLNIDRADVIIPASKIYLSSMKWSGARDIYVPKIGLSDGIIKSIYHDTVASVKI